MRLVKVLETQDEDFLDYITLKWTCNSVLGLLGPWAILGQVWEACSDLFIIHSEEQQGFGLLWEYEDL